MPERVLLDTATISFQELLEGSREYRVPPFQRAYSWDEDNWEDLWEDIRPGTDMANPHYMGAIVLRKISRGEFEIVDGQQRFATLSLFALAALYWLKKLQDDGISPQKNAEHYEKIRNTYLGEKSPGSFRYSNKLTLNSNDNDFYRDYLLQIKEPHALETSSKSNRLLYGAYLYFREKLGDEAGLVSDGAKLASFLDDVLWGKCIFLRIVVDDELTAYTVFETLNARGVDLTPTDLLKNYLFSFFLVNVEQNSLNRQWDRISNMVGSERMPEFFRHQLNSRRAFVRPELLFKTIREEVKEREDVSRLVDDLERDAKVYAMIRMPGDPHWNGNHEIRKYIRALRLFDVRQALPLLLAGYNHFGGERLTNEFRDILRISFVISFRHLVISGLGSNPLERAYNEAAVAITKKIAETPGQAFRVLKEAYVDDETFEKNFSSAMLRNDRHARYVLYELENDLRKRSDVSGVSPVDVDTDTGTLEHVLPVNPSEIGKEEFGAWYDEYVYRLGNMTLLSGSDNRKAGNLDFSEKRELMSGSEYLLSSGIGNVNWVPQVVVDRQAEMARRAVHIWRLDFDS